MNWHKIGFLCLAYPFILICVPVVCVACLYDAMMGAGKAVIQLFDYAHEIANQ